MASVPFSQKPLDQHYLEVEHVTDGYRRVNGAMSAADPSIRDLSGSPAMKWRVFQGVSNGGSPQNMSGVKRVCFWEDKAPCRGGSVRFDGDNYKNLHQELTGLGPNGVVPLPRATKTKSHRGPVWKLRTLLARRSKATEKVPLLSLVALGNMTSLAKFDLSFLWVRWC